MNPFAFAYTSTEGLQQYAQPTGIVITGRSNRNDPAFAAVRAGGGEVLAYINPVEIAYAPSGVLHHMGALDAEFNAPDKVEFWPLKTADGKDRINFRAPDGKYVCRLANILPGSRWSKWFLEYVQRLQDQVDGVFIDVAGARLWSAGAAWATWPQWEQQLWSFSNVELVRQLRAVTRDGFVIVNNNTWGDLAFSREGEKHVNGICFEHNEPNAYHAKIAARAYGDGRKRRVFGIARPAQLAGYLALPGITHINHDVNDSYGKVTPPAVPFEDLRPGERPAPPLETLEIAPGVQIHGSASALAVARSRLDERRALAQWRDEATATFARLHEMMGV